jgi:adenylate kinase family enzyme
MKKIIIIGCPGSGKTTFAEKLKDKIGLPLFHLDAIWHKPDRTHISREEYDARLTEILALDSWIIDGNYSRTIESRILACDTVFLFDLPVEVCLEGAIFRLGKERYDMPWIDTELDPNFKREIVEFPNKNLPTIYALIDKYRDKKTVVVFKSRKQADAFLNGENI